MKISFKIAFSGLMAALSVAIMLLSGFIPIFTYVSPLAASIFLVPVMIEIDRKWGWMTWGAAGILSLMVCADKEAAFFYIFVGYYPLIKGYLDKIRSKAIRVLAKLAVFAVAIGLMYLLLIFVFALPDVLNDFAGVSTVLNIVMFAVMVFIMLCFDIIVRFAEMYYTKRIKPKMRSISRH